MLTAIYLRQFEKEAAKAKKRGKDLRKLKVVMALLIHEEPLLAQHRHHKLKGDLVGYWECHIEPDWLLVYRKTDTEITFVRTGTHSDLF